MGYKNFQVIKDVYLPIPATDISIKDYKETYGIDLKKYIILQGNYIKFIFPINEKVWFTLSEPYPNFPSVISTFTKITEIEYVSGDDHGELILVSTDVGENLGVGVRFSIDKDKTFDLDNLFIGYYEI